MTRATHIAQRTALSAAICLPLAAAAQPDECLGYELKSPDQSLTLMAPTHTWTLFNLGPGRILIRSSTGETLPGPAPSSDPRPLPFRGVTGTSYELALDGPGLSIVYICPDA